MNPLRTFAATILLTLGLAHAAEPVLPPATPGVPVKFSLIKTGETPTRDALTWKGGGWTKAVVANHVAVLVDHPSGRFLLDTGLGAHTAQHFDAEMPWWVKPFMRYTAGQTARAQLDARGEPAIDRIVLTHGHWDHVAGLLDFPEAEVWTLQAEREFLRTARPPAVLPSQVASPTIRWHAYTMDMRPWGPFDTHLDVFGDGTVVLVPLPGHTPGAVGLALTLGSGRRVLFVGDAVWRAEAIGHDAPKPWLSRWLVDHDADGTLDSVRFLHTLAAANPGLVMVPAHDAEVHEGFGYYPRWAE